MERDDISNRFLPIVTTDNSKLHLLFVDRDENQREKLFLCKTKILQEIFQLRDEFWPSLCLLHPSFAISYAPFLTRKCNDEPTSHHV